MLSVDTIDFLAKTLPLREEVRAFKRQGEPDLKRFKGPTPADQMRRPWVVEANGRILDDVRGTPRRFGSEQAALSAARQLIQQIWTERLGTTGN